MKFILKCLLVFIVALILGVGSTFYFLSNPDIIRSKFILSRLGFILNGPWSTSLTFGSKTTGVYEKAIVATIGLFALNKTETVYYSAFTDSKGETLNSKYSYRIEGENIDTRWWSLTVYGEDSFLIPNKYKLYSYSMNNIKRESDGRYIIYLSKKQQKENWLPSGDNEQNLSLTLRLYNPSPAVYENLETIRLPRIIKEVQ
jgi:hypothetical protein